jgi:transposase
MISQEEWMDLKILNHQGLSIRAIARQTGLARQTVKRALAATVPDKYKPRPPQAKKLDPYLDHLNAAIETRPWMRAARLYREIREKGNAGRYEAVKVFVRQQRAVLQAKSRASVRFETLPGQEAQFDWKGPVKGLIIGAPEVGVHFFRFLLGYSRYRVTRAVTVTTLPAVLWDLRQVFEELGGVPNRIVFDNFKAAVLDPRPHLRLHPFFADFSAHYGYEPWPALPRSPQRKGKTERTYRDLEESGLLHQTYPDLPALQAAIDDEDRRQAETPHSTTGEEPIVRLQRELPFLLPLPGVAFDVRLPETRRVLSDCTISYHGAYYSVPYQWVGQRLTVKAEPHTGELSIFARATLVATHQRAPKGSRVIVEEHIAELRRPRWDRLRRGSPVKASSPVAAQIDNQLVHWPSLSVELRPLVEYARLIEEVSR